MAPKKGQKMSLNAFLEDSTLGSWADEMDALPSAPAPKTDDAYGRSDRYGTRDRDFMSTRPDRASFPPREEIPLPTQPPYTAFVGNLPFDLTESELGDFFGPHGTKSVKIIKDREDKPKGFGYVEFDDLEGLKAALAKSGDSFANRPIRVSVAEPQKDRPHGFAGPDDDKFAGPWRRDGPLPDRSNDREPPRRRFEGLGDRADKGDSVAEGNRDWRANRPPPRFAEPELPPVRRRGSGFSTPEGHPSAVETEEHWQIGGKFKPSVSGGSDAPPTNRFSAWRGKGDMGPPPAAEGENDWRARSAVTSRNSTSPTSSVPSTPQMGRRKLELLPRTSSASTSPTPLSSPKSASHTTSTRSNPFGAAKPVDVTARERLVEERIEKEKEEVREKTSHSMHSMSRQSSRQARERPPVSNAEPRTSPPVSTPASPRAAVSTVRPSFSFANAARASKSAANDTETKADDAQGTQADEAAQVAEKLAEVSV